jgi:hypothetical protein
MTTKDQIRRWLLRAQKESKYSHVMIVVDQFDYEDYPVLVSSDEDIQKVFEDYNNKSMQKVMEVYSLSMDLEDQLNEYRAFHF